MGLMKDVKRTDTNGKWDGKLKSYPYLPGIQVRTGSNRSYDNKARC